VTFSATVDPRAHGGVTVIEDLAARRKREEQLTDLVAASFDGSPSDRYREVLQSLVRHLHSFAREVRLTEEEWQRGVEFLTRCGHITDDRRQEFILLSDVLGLSMLTVGINAAASPDATESTVFGPFFVEGAPEVPLGGDISGGAEGMPCHVSGTVRSTSGEPVPGARIDVWEADADGFYDVQYEGERTAGRAWLRTGAGGGYRFWAVRPAAYGIPADGPVGDLLAAAGRGPMRPAHIHLMVTAPGYRRLVTHVFVAGDPYLSDDAVFGVKESLVREFERHPPGEGPDGRNLTVPWSSVDVDLVLASDDGEPP
jgi:hydroxyquinol 1,2-dioxygenase